MQRIEQLAQQGGVSMWEAVDGLVAEPAADPVQKAIARKAAEFVAMVRSLSLARNEKGIYDFGLEIAARSGILGLYRRENTPEAASALGNIEELLNSMQLFKEQRDAEIRSGERTEDEQATIEEWLQNAMLMTDMDKEDPEDRDKVTLMTVHSAKGLEYEFVYIVGMEENLFPSARAAESPDGFEEERRLFYVALTRAKTAATLSYAEMRFKWGNMEFSRPSCFLREIDPRYLEAAVEDAESADDRAEERRGPAIDALRRRFDYRYGRPQGAAGGEGASSPAGGRYAARTGGGRPGGYGPAGRSGGAGARATGRADGFGASAARGKGPDPSLVAAPRTSTEGMRRLGVRSAGEVPAAAAPDPAAGAYAVGDRVEHARFGAGTVRAVEALAADRKLTVAFDNHGEKTLLARFAKLTRL